MLNKKIFRLHLKNSHGFTLIELLLVIVIIGILAGTIITLINPIQQQNRAKDANVKSALSKIALATQSFISAYGTIPKDTEFILALNAATGTGCSDGDYTCSFSIGGVEMPTGCGTGSYSTSPCLLKYVGNISNKTFTLYAKSFGLSTGVFSFTNDPLVVGVGQILQCTDAATPTDCVSPATP